MAKHSNQPRRGLRGTPRNDGTVACRRTGTPSVDTADRLPLPALVLKAWASTCLFALVLLPVLFALGCAATRQAQLQDVDFRLRGRIGLKEPSAEAHGGRPRARALSTSFDWQQAGERFRIEFWGAFGQGRALLFGDGATVSLRDARGNVTSGVDVDALMEQTLGWAVPVAALRHWVRGRVDPSLAAAAEQRDSEGNLARFEQSGWTIRLSRWRQTAIGAAPGRVVAERAGRVVTVICKEWWLD